MLLKLAFPYRLIQLDVLKANRGEVAAGILELHAADAVGLLVETKHQLAEHALHVATLGGHLGTPTVIFVIQHDVEHRRVEQFLTRGATHDDADNALVHAARLGVQGLGLAVRHFDDAIAIDDQGKGIRLRVFHRILSGAA